MGYTELGFHKAGEQTAIEPVSDLRPFPVEIPEFSGSGLPPVAGRSVFRTTQIPGIGTAAAYQDGDCFGTIIQFPNLFRPEKLSGLIHTGIYFDLDDEGLQIDLHLFSTQIPSPGADNAAFSPSDTALLSYVGTLSFTSFYNFGANQVSVVTNAGLVVVSSSTTLWGHAVARGALNIAASNIPVLGLGVLQD